MKRITAIMIIVCMILIGCGKKDVVTDYGDRTDSNTSGDEKAVANNESSSDALEKQTGQEEAGIVGKLGTSHISWEDELETEGRAVEVKVEYDVPDADRLGVYRFRKINDDCTREKLIIDNIFGDSAKKIERLSDIDAGLSDKLINGQTYSWLVAKCVSIISLDQNDGNTLENGGESGLETDMYSKLLGQFERKDNEGNVMYYLHWYMGKYENVDCALLYGYSYSTETEYISFCPLMPADYIGVSDVNAVISDCDYIDGGGDTENAGNTVVNLNGDIKNLYDVSDGELISRAEDFLADKLDITTYDGELSFNLGDCIYDGLYGLETKGRTEMLFVDMKDKGYDYDVKEKDGYALYLNSRFSGLPVAMITDKLNGYKEGMCKYNLYNAGEMKITSKGLYSFDITRQMDVQEVLSDDAPFLTADNILASFENAIPEAVKDDAFANIRHMVFDKTMLVYYPVESPEKNGDYTYIPTWVFCGHDSGSNNFAIYINAIDGSLAGVE